MKYVVLLGDGMGDYAYASLGGKTPLQAAYTPHMDRLAQRGELGLVNTIPEGFAPGSDVGNMTALGYDPRQYYTGRAPIEAASMGLHLAARDIAYRCNLVRLKTQHGQTIMADYSAGHIDNALAHQLMKTIQATLGGAHFAFHPGVSYRHIMIWAGGPAVERSTPPHDILGQPIEPHLPQGNGAAELIDLMTRSQELLDGQQANAIWLWGCGPMPQLPSFKETFGVDGAIISAVDLVKGLGVLVGLEVPHVPGATGYLDTDYAGKVKASLEALEKHDFIYVHIEAPDETGHEGDLGKKIRALEDFDARVVGPILETLPAFGPHAVLLLPDHYTPVRVRTHVAEPVPFALFRSDVPQHHPHHAYSEPDAAKTNVHLQDGFTLMRRLIARDT